MSPIFSESPNLKASQPTLRHANRVLVVFIAWDTYDNVGKFFGYDRRNLLMTGCIWMKTIGHILRPYLTERRIHFAEREQVDDRDIVLVANFLDCIHILIERLPSTVRKVIIGKRSAKQLACSEAISMCRCDPYQFRIRLSLLNTWDDDIQCSIK